MAEQIDLEAAEAAGVITPEQAAQLRRLKADDPGAPPLSGDQEETLRFINSFHDVFIAIGVLLVWLGLSVFTAQASGPLVVMGAGAGNVDTLGRIGLLVLAGINAGAAALFWGGAEYFTRMKRRLLPSIVLFLAFFFYAWSACSYLYASTIYRYIVTLDLEMSSLDQVSGVVRFSPLILASLAAAVSAAFYTRFKLPFSMGWLGGVAAILVATLMFALAPKMLAANLFAILFLIGVIMMLIGVAWDMRDPARVSRLSDNGFWLHFFAAPAILNGALLWSRFGPGPNESMDMGNAFNASQSVVTLIILAIFAIVSLLINRRALVVAGLLSAGIAIGVLVRESGMDGAWVAASTLLALGAGVVLLGAGWHAVRRLLTAPLPKQGMIARIVPPVTVDG